MACLNEWHRYPLLRLVLQMPNRSERRKHIHCKFIELLRSGSIHRFLASLLSWLRAHRSAALPCILRKPFRGDFAETKSEAFSTVALVDSVQFWTAPVDGTSPFFSNHCQGNTKSHDEASRAPEHLFYVVTISLSCGCGTDVRFSCSNISLSPHNHFWASGDPMMMMSSNEHMWSSFASTTTVLPVEIDST